MPNLNIQSLNLGDSQEDIREKVNSNFDSVVSAGGGPQGITGKDGDQGAIGPAGPKGDPGQEGIRGTKWFVQGAEPLGGSSDPILQGDYWVDTALNNSIYQYSSSGWVDTGNNLSATDVFETLSGIAGPTGGKNAIVMSSPLPGINTFVISDSIASTATVNPTYAKFLISTNGNNDYPIMEFSKTNASGIGTPADYNRHPQFRWLDPSGNNYDLLFSVPQDDLEIRSGGAMTLQSSTSTLSLIGNSGLSLTSGSQFSFTSAGTMSFSSGSSLMTFASQKFNLSSTSLAISVPLSVTGTSSQSPLLNLINTGSGDTLKITSTSSSNSSYLMRLISVSTERFSVRNDGKVKFQRQVNATNDATSSTASLSVNISGVGTFDSWFYGPVAGNTSQGVSTSVFGPGNIMYADWTTSNNRIIGIPNPGGSTTTSWREYLSSNESIVLHYYAASGKEFDGITKVESSGPPTSFGAYEMFSTAASYVQVTIIKFTTTAKCYYSTCAGECGVLF